MLHLRVSSTLFTVHELIEHEIGKRYHRTQLTASYSRVFNLGLLNNRPCIRHICLMMTIHIFDRSLIYLKEFRATNRGTNTGSNCNWPCTGSGAVALVKGEAEVERFSDNFCIKFHRLIYTFIRNVNISGLYPSQNISGLHQCPLTAHRPSGTDIKSNVSVRFTVLSSMQPPTGELPWAIIPATTVLKASSLFTFNTYAAQWALAV
jgi:hypothetical protein